MAKDYQQDGFVHVTSTATKALAEANRQIQVARKVTPVALQERYRSQIRYLSSQNGYAWYWVLK